MTPDERPFVPRVTQPAALRRQSNLRPKSQFGATLGFTQVTVTGNYGVSASGLITFTLTQPMANNDAILLPEPVIVTLAGGAFSTTLAANDDTTTVPQGVFWAVTETIAGCQPRDYFITVAAASAPTVDISTLMPGQIGWT